MELAEISPAEIVADMLVRWGDPAVDVVIGPTNDEQQQAGVVGITSAGLPQVEKYVPTHWLRAQVRCLAPSLAMADTIGQSVQRDLHGRYRTRARMASTGQWYLVHLSNITAGPSMHYDGPETWEILLFAEIMIATEAL